MKTNGDRLNAYPQFYINFYTSSVRYQIQA